jgi:hypothetical protein
MTPDEQYPAHLMPFGFGEFEVTPEEELLEKVVVAYNKGMTLATVAERFDLTISKVRKLLGHRLRTPKTNSRYDWFADVGGIVVYDLPVVGHPNRANRVRVLQRSLTNWQKKYNQHYTYDVQGLQFKAKRVK